MSADSDKSPAELEEQYNFSRRIRHEMADFYRATDVFALSIRYEPFAFARLLELSGNRNRAGEYTRRSSDGGIAAYWPRKSPNLDPSGEYQPSTITSIPKKMMPAANIAPPRCPPIAVKRRACLTPSVGSFCLHRRAG